jgi:hypothetical protein
MGGSEIIWLLFFIVVGVGFYVWTQKRRQVEESRIAQRQEAQRPHIQERLEGLEAGETIDELEPFFKFRPQKGEIIYAAVPCYRRQLKSETTGVSYGGPSVRFRIAKGVYWRAASYRGVRHKEDVLRQLGAGYLVVTNKRLAFVAQDDGSNWVRRWSSVVSWRVEDSTLVVEGTSGRPMLFETDVDSVQEIPVGYVDAHPQVLKRILEIASGERPALGAG